MTFLVYLALLLIVGMSAQWLAWRFKLPSILLLLIFGYGLAHFTGHKIDNYLADESSLISLIGYFVAIILFEGGLTLKFSELKEAGTPVRRMCTYGVLIAGLLTTTAASMIMGYPLSISALIGAILVVTGPTVVSPLLRVIKPSRKLASIVKWEGIVVDPIGAILAVLIFQTAVLGGSEKGWVEGIWLISKMILIGGVMAWLLATLITHMMKRHWIPDFLESLFFLAVVAAAFAGSNMLQAESGLLTVTVMGIVLANQKQVSVRHILEFKENLRVLIISLLFLMLSGRIELAELVQVWERGLIFLLVLIVIVRPVSVVLANLFSKQTTTKELIFLSLLAPRGIVAAAVTSVFALEIEHAAHLGKLSSSLVPYANELVPLVFIIIIGTVAFYGLLAAPLARKLGLAKKIPDGIIFAGANTWARKAAKALHDDGHGVLLLDTRFENIADAKMEGLRAVCANILSEYAEEELDFSGLGHLIACTPNDEVNSLASREFTHHFGKANVWQLTSQDAQAHHTKAVSSRIRGRVCFSSGPTFRQLESFALRGAVVKKTQLTEVFTLEDFRRVHGESAIIMFMHDEERGLRPVEAETIDKIPAEVAIYSFVIPETEKKNE